MCSPALLAAHLHDGIFQSLQGLGETNGIAFSVGIIKALHYDGVPWPVNRRDGDLVLAEGVSVVKHGGKANGEARAPLKRQ